MKLTSHTDYSLRLLMYLNANTDRLCTIQEIADAHKISKNHLMKLAFKLGKAEYIQTVRGRSGGLRLNRPATEINLGAVVRFTEESLDIVECFDPETNSCQISGACKLTGILKQALNAFINVLDGYTLADLAQDKNMFQKLMVTPT